MLRPAGRTVRSCGFTLIELAVVVAIMGVLAAVAIPKFASLVQRSNHAAREAAAQAEAARAAQARPAAPAEREPVVEGALPDLRSAAVRIGLKADYRRYGMEVYPMFRADYSARVTLEPPAGRPGPVRLFFPFPDGTTEARDVFLYFLRGQERVEPDEVRYDKLGIHWYGSLPPGPTEAELRFTAEGRERFALDLPAARRTRALRMEMELDGLTAEALPEHALQPTRREGTRLVWEAHNLVSDRRLLLDIPRARSPMGRVALLFRLVGLAVLLFGAGFWYMWEQYQPGRHGDFRWGDFLLLASTYSLFFVNFAVLSYHGDLDTAAAMAVAAAMSLPLLALHVARIVDRRFALTRTVPLAVYTLGLVINGVYGGPVRDYVFLGGAFVAIAYLTISYPVRPRRPGLAAQPA